MPAGLGAYIITLASDSGAAPISRPTRAIRNGGAVVPQLSAPAPLPVGRVYLVGSRASAIVAPQSSPRMLGPCGLGAGALVLRGYPKPAIVPAGISGDGARADTGAGAGPIALLVTPLGVAEVPATAIGAGATITLAALTAMGEGAAAAAGVGATVTLIAPSGEAIETVIGAGTGATITLVALVGTGKGAALARGAGSTIHLVAPAGVGLTSTAATGQGAGATITLVALAGQALAAARGLGAGSTVHLVAPVGIPRFAAHAQGAGAFVAIDAATAILYRNDVALSLSVELAPLVLTVTLAPGLKLSGAIGSGVSLASEILSGIQLPTTL